MINDNYQHFNIKRNNRTVLIRIPTYLLIDYAKIVINVDITELTEKAYKAVKKHIRNYIQELYDNNLEVSPKKSTFTYHIEKLIYKKIQNYKTNKMFNIYKRDFTKD